MLLIDNIVKIDTVEESVLKFTGLSAKNRNTKEYKGIRIMQETKIFRFYLKHSSICRGGFWKERGCENLKRKCGREGKMNSQCLNEVLNKNLQNVKELRLGNIE